MPTPVSTMHCRNPQCDVAISSVPDLAELVADADDETRAAIVTLARAAKLSRSAQQAASVHGDASPASLATRESRDRRRDADRFLHEYLDAAVNVVELLGLTDLDTEQQPVEVHWTPSRIDEPPHPVGDPKCPSCGSEEVA